MTTRSPMLSKAYTVRDEIAILINEFEQAHPGVRLQIIQEYAPDAPGQPRVTHLSVMAVARNGEAKSTLPVEVANA